MTELHRHYFRVRFTRGGEGVNVCLFAFDADDAVRAAKETLFPNDEWGTTEDDSFDGDEWLVASVEQTH